MQFYSQKNPKWSNLNLGDTNLKVKDFGCLSVCLAMVLNKTPDEILSHKELYDSEGRIKSYQQVADTFGSQLISEIPDPVIIKTTFDGSMHFIVRYQGQLYDPLSLIGKPLRDYKITSYVRLKPLTGGSMAGKLYDNNGQVWISYNGKKFYVEAPQDFGTETIIKGDAPGEIMIKRSDSETLVKEAVGGLQGQIDGLNEQIKSTTTALEACEKAKKDFQDLNADLLDKNKKLDELNDELIKESDEYRKEQEKKTKELEESLEKCLANSEVKPSWFKKIIEKIKKLKKG